jgi:hypothetical protein
MAILSAATDNILLNFDENGTYFSLWYRENTANALAIVFSYDIENGDYAPLMWCCTNT